MSRGIGSTQKKILLLLAGGLSLSLSHSPHQYFRILKMLGKEWREINQDSLRKAIKGLYQSRLIDIKENPDNTVTMVLSTNGKKKVKILTYNLENVSVKIPQHWDKLWRLIIFDIPKHMKKEREVFRTKLRHLGFYLLQKSVYIFPYNCSDEIDFLIEFLNVRPYVRQLVVKEIDNEIHLKDIFENILR